MRRLSRAVIPILAVMAIAFVAQKIFGDNTMEPRLVSSEPVAMIGSGSEAVAVAEDGTVLAWFPPGDDVHLPALSIDSPPKGPRVAGPALEQVRVLAATPVALRPYVERSYFGESGVDVELRSGFELLFGNAADARRKWKAAAAVLASPEVSSFDYVDLHAPGHPSVGGSGHTLPPVP